jgi:hypothetical protein
VTGLWRRLRRARSPNGVGPSPPASADEVEITYFEDRLSPLTASERAQMPAISRCINCGLCALVARRLGGVRPPDLAAAYLRDVRRMPAARADLSWIDPGSAALAAAAAACPVGVPLEECVAMMRRWAAAP